MCFHLFSLEKSYTGYLHHTEPGFGFQVHGIILPSCTRTRADMVVIGVCDVDWNWRINRDKCQTYKRYTAQPEFHLNISRHFCGTIFCFLSDLNTLLIISPFLFRNILRIFFLFNKRNIYITQQKLAADTKHALNPSWRTLCTIILWITLIT